MATTTAKQRLSPADRTGVRVPALNVTNEDHASPSCKTGRFAQNPWDAWLTPKQTSEITNYSVEHLARLRSEGGGPTFAKLGLGRTAQVRYRRSDVEDWFEAHIRANTAGASK
jgi:hypothetical protein